MAILRLLAFIFMVLMTFTGVRTQAQTATPEAPQPFADLTDPVSLLASYYNAINLRDYDRAYSYLASESSGRTVTQFAQGFANTMSVDVFVRVPYHAEGAAGSVYASIPALIIADTTDGQEVYLGCFVMRRSNVPQGRDGTIDANWQIDRADVQSLTRANPVLLEVACAQTPIDSLHNDTLTPVDTLMSYYDAIVRRDYARAYGYWQSPPFGLSLSQFQRGFAQTQNVEVIIGLSFRAGVAAGSAYLSMPVLLNATLDTGERQTFVGCYVFRQSNVPVGNATEPDPTWWLYNAQVVATSNVEASLSLSSSVCAGV